MTKIPTSNRLCLLLLFSLVALVLVFSVLPYSKNPEYGYNIPVLMGMSQKKPTRVPKKGPAYPPVLAYWILGGHGDSKRMLRLLKAIYHPRNQYLLQLHSSSSVHEREELVLAVQSQAEFGDFANVNVVGRSYAVNQMGSSALAAALHAAALLLWINGDWDWFVPLSASDYPLLSQDDILYAFAVLPRDLNFISYNSSRWRDQNINQIAVDPSLHCQENTPIFYAKETRPTPDAFTLFKGSPSMTLSRTFMEYCVYGWDNLPRKLLMYFTNVASPLNSYFQTVLCNSPQFQNTSINHNTRYILVGGENEQSTNMINTHLLQDLLTASNSKGAVFARPFREDDPLLQKMDEIFLNQELNKTFPSNVQKHAASGSSSSSFSAEDQARKEDWNTSCRLVCGDIDVVKPGPRGVRLGELLLNLSKDDRLRTGHCKES